MDSEFGLFGQLPEPLRAAVYAEAWRDKGAWQSEQERKGLRLVCRQARSAVDAAIDSVSRPPIPEFIRAAALGRFPSLRVLKADGGVQDAATTLALVHSIPPRLQKLSLSFCPFDTSVASALAATGAELCELTLERSGISDNPLQMLMQRPWPALEVLQLTFTSVGKQGAASLAAASAAHLLALRELDLSCSLLGTGGVESLASGTWHCLEVLKLRSNHFHAEGAGALAAASAAARFPKLRALDISESSLGDAGTTALLTTAWPCLVRLDLSDNELGPAGAAELAAASAARLPRLTELYMSDNNLELAGVQELLQGSWSRLETLELHTTILDQAGAAAIGAAAARLPALRELDLSDNDIDAAGVQSLLQSSWPRLESLDLGGNEWMESEGAAVVAAAVQAARLPALRKLSLYGIEMANEGLQALAEAVWPAFEDFDIEDNGISHAGVEALVAAGKAHFPALIRLHIQDPITLDDVHAIKAIWPGVSIE